MEWDRVKEQLESVLGAPMQWTTCSEERWNAWGAGPNGVQPSSKSIVRDGKQYFLVYREGREVFALAIDEMLVTDSERRLVEFALEAYRSQGRKTANVPASEDEKKALAIRDWCNRQLELGLMNAEMPDALLSQMSLYSAKVPLLLTGDYSQSRRVSYADLKKLLESFFDAEVILIPLMEKEWLILGSEMLLAASAGGRDGGEEESLEDSLASICQGLHEMLANEWVGECHLAIHYPMTPARSLLGTIVQLRETLQLGRAFHVGSNIHLPWELRLEKLLNAVPEADKLVFLEHVLGRFDHLLDAETLTTLETFFALDCNVSETAKKLYIHRNTLLYRLDKFKQETGLDARNFGAAVLVKVAFLLYKVTKRK